MLNILLNILVVKMKIVNLNYLIKIYMEYWVWFRRLSFRLSNVDVELWGIGFYDMYIYIS